MAAAPRFHNCSAFRTQKADTSASSTTSSGQASLGITSSPSGNQWKVLRVSTNFPAPGLWILTQK